MHDLALTGAISGYMTTIMYCNVHFERISDVSHRISLVSVLREVGPVLPRIPSKPDDAAATSLLFVPMQWTYVIQVAREPPKRGSS